MLEPVLSTSVLGSSIVSLSGNESQKMALLPAVAKGSCLLAFAYAVKRLRLTTIGMLQYLAPSIQFALAITVFGEELNAMRLFSFFLIWVSLVVFTFDGWQNRRVVEAA